MDSIEGFILAGGASRRMGTHKARLTLNGQTFVERILPGIISRHPCCIHRRQQCRRGPN